MLNTFQHVKRSARQMMALPFLLAGEREAKWGVVRCCFDPVWQETGSYYSMMFFLKDLCYHGHHSDRYHWRVCGGFAKKIRITAGQAMWPRRAIN